MSACPSCGFKWQSEGLEKAGGACPRCGVRPLQTSMAPVYTALVALLSILMIAIGAISAGMPASPYLLGTGTVLLVACVATIVRAARA